MFEKIAYEVRTRMRKSSEKRENGEAEEWQKKEKGDKEERRKGEKKLSWSSQFVIAI